MNYNLKNTFKAILSLLATLLFCFQLSSQILVKGSGIRYYQGYTIATYPTATAPVTSVGTEFSYFIDLNIVCKWDRVNSRWVPVNNILVQSGVPAHTPATGDPLTYLDKDTGNLYKWNGSAWELLINAGSTVTSITNLGDTTSLTPITGDEFVVATMDTSGVYSTDRWLLRIGGAGGGVSDGDSLWNHTATQNIDQDTFWLSPDGTSKGIQFPSSNGYIYESLVNATYRQQTTLSISTLTTGIIDDAFLSSQISYVKDATNPRLDFNFNSISNWRIFKDHLGVIPPTSDPVDVTFGDDYFYFYPLRSGAAGTGVLKYRDGTSGTEETLATTGQIDSTRLLQDSILVYYAAGSEIGRDTIPVSLGSGGSGGGHIIADEGTAVTARDTLNFVGDGVSVVSGATKTTVTIPVPEINDLTNVNVTGASSGQVVKYNGTTWYAADDNSSNVSGSVVGNEYPLIQFYENSFTDSLGTWANFSSGKFFHDVVDNRAGIVGLGGVWTGTPLLEGNRYVMVLDVDDPGLGIRAYQEWSDLISTDTILTSGIHELVWTQNTDGSGDQNPVIRTLGADTAYLNNLYIFEYSDYFLIQDKFTARDSVNAEVSYQDVSKGYLYANNFLRDKSNVNSDQASTTLGKGILTLNYTGTNGIVSFGDTSRFSADSWYDVSIDVESISDTIRLRVAAANNPSETYFDITKAGKYSVMLYRDAKNNASLTDRLNITAPNYDSPFSVVIGSVSVKSGLDRKQIFGDYNTISSTNELAIGNNIEVDLNKATVYGNNAKAVFDVSYVPAGNGSSDCQCGAIGESAESKGWRAWASGPYSRAYALSSHADGVFSYAGAIHSVSIGRGAFIDTMAVLDGVVNLGSTSNNDLYVGNAWAHQFREPFSDIGQSNIVGDRTTPSNEETRYHGVDAWDTDGTEDDLNVNAGHAAIVGGLSTGSGLGGEVRFRTASGSTAATGNTKKSDVIQGYFSAETQSTLIDGTRFYLKDVEDESLKRVKIQKDSTLHLGVLPTTDYGSASGTTDVSGDLTVSHSLGSASIFVTATGTGTTFYNVQVHTKTTTTFKIRFFDAAGSAITSTAVTADWFAKR